MRPRNPLCLALLFSLLSIGCGPWNSNLGRRTLLEDPKTRSERERTMSSLRTSAPTLFTNPAEKLTFDAGRDTVLFGKKGTQLVYHGGSLLFLDGSVVEGQVTLLLQEAYSVGEMIVLDAPTTADGRLLESGGELYLEIWQGTSKLWLDPRGRGMEITMTSLLQDRMELFAGGRSTLGRLNWGKDSLLSPLNFADALQSSQARDTAELALIEAEGFAFNGDTEVPNYIFNTKRLGWINCDRFYADSSEKKALVVKLDNPLPEGLPVMAYLVFPGLQAVLPVYSVDQIQFEADGIPAAQTMTLILIGKVDQQFFFKEQEVTLMQASTYQVSLEPTTEAEVRKALEKY